MNTKHTPTPWTPEIINRWPEENEGANREFMLRAVNAHEEMLYLLKTIQEEFEAGRRLGMTPGSAFALKVRDAIAKAEGR